jgi:hypothetical protein
MDLLQVLQAFWQSLVSSLGGEALSVLFVAGFTAAMVMLWLGVSAFRKTEFYKQHAALWNLIDDKIADLIWLIEFGDVDLTDYEHNADVREQEGKTYIDPRMLYLLDKAEKYIQEQYNVTVNLEDLLGRAEHIFDEIKNDDSNGVGE